MNFSELFNYNKNTDSQIKAAMCLLNCSESEAVMYLKKGDNNNNDCKRAETQNRSFNKNTFRA